MKLRQKIYDSSERTNKLIKITNSYHLFKNLEKIKNRKPIYANNNYPPKKINQNLNEYYINKDNKFKNNILDKKSTKNAYENYIDINNLFNNKESRLVNSKLVKENENYIKRINNQKPFISSKSLDKEYKMKVAMKKYKKNGSKNVLLPPI